MEYEDDPDQIISGVSELLDSGIHETQDELLVQENYTQEDEQNYGLYIQSDLERKLQRQKEQERLNEQLFTELEQEIAQERRKIEQETTEQNYEGSFLTTLIFLWYIKNTYTIDLCVFNFICVYNHYNNTFHFQNLDTTIPDFYKIILQIHNCNKKYTIIPIFIEGTGNIGHCTILLINHRLGTMEYYDPHGYPLEDTSSFLHLQTHLSRIASLLNLKLQNSALTCPTQHIGALQHELGFDNVKDIGYCIIHSFVFVLLRLEHQNLTMDQLVVRIRDYMIGIKVNTYMNHIASIIVNKAIDIAYKLGIESTRIIDINESINAYYSFHYLLQRMYEDRPPFNFSPDVQMFIPIPRLQ